MAPRDKIAATMRPAQVLLTERDRGVGEQITLRVRQRGGRVSGPTALYRAGLLALNALSDDALVHTFDEVEERLGESALLELFDTWCALIVQRVAKDYPGLEYAWQAASNSENCYGYFSHMGRFVALTLNVADGRVFMTGMEITTPIGDAGVPRAHMPFPGGLATLLSMNEDGAALAVRMIGAWLIGTADDVNAIRADISKHRPEPLR